MKKNNRFSFGREILSAILPILYFTASALAQRDSKTQDWPVYNRTLDGDRYSPLKQVTTANVKQLHLLHTFDLGNDISSLQTGPVVINGTMYFTTDTTTYAIAASNGKLLWKTSTGLPTGGGIISYAVNGKQYIAIAAGMKSPVWPGAPKKSQIMIYGL